MPPELGLGILWYAVFITSLTCHEAAHSLAALKLGDPTAHHAGLVTLDPVTHIRRSPFGMVIVPIATFVMGGWMMGLIVAWCLVDFILDPIQLVALNLLYPGAGYH